MIALEKITFGYGKKQQPLFSDFSLELKTGHIHGLLGSNGTGKTTLLKIMCGLIEAKGSVRILDQDPLHRRPALYRELFVIPEEFGLPALTFRKYAKVTSPFYPEYSGEALEYYAEQFEVDMTKRLDKMSMGQRKKAFIAFALACNTSLLIMDEPTNGLDIPSKSTFRRLIAGYADENRTVIISTHQVRDIENLIDNVVIIDRKGLLMNKTTEEITAKFRFGIVKPGEVPIYSEDTLHGIYGVTENKEKTENKINLEILFNAGMKHRDQITRIING